jgi:hypothetical protein
VPVRISLKRANILHSAINVHKPFVVLEKFRVDFTRLGIMPSLNLREKKSPIAGFARVQGALSKLKLNDL